ncbi:MAG: hypothetical protein HQ582_02450 [Planctomycetes bacterium]|nr:hypothetical protein [Planctomycetota bacterium]
MKTSLSTILGVHCVVWMAFATPTTGEGLSIPSAQPFINSARDAVLASQPELPPNALVAAVFSYEYSLHPVSNTVNEFFSVQFRELGTVVVSSEYSDSYSKCFVVRLDTNGTANADAVRVMLMKAESRVVPSWREAVAVPAQDEICIPDQSELVRIATNAIAEQKFPALVDNLELREIHYVARFRNGGALLRDRFDVFFWMPDSVSQTFRHDGIEVIAGQIAVRIDSDGQVPKRRGVSAFWVRLLCDNETGEMKSARTGAAAGVSTPLP